MSVLRDELYSIACHWNTHNIRHVNNSESPGGRPDQLYLIPQTQGNQDYKCLPQEFDLTLEAVEELYCCRPGIRMGLLSRISRASKYTYVGRKPNNAKKCARS